MTNLKFPRLSVAGGVIGIVLVIFGIVWMTAIFERFEKVPTDLDRTVDLEGTYTLVDPFVAELQGNATVMGLAASGGAEALLGDPAIAGLLTNPALGTLMASPDVLGLLGDPAAMAALGNPALLSLLSDPAAMGALSDPAAMMAMAAADPAIGALLADPAVIGLLTNPAVATLTSQPELMALLPALGPVLANPIVGALLADPAALGLIMDSRTQQILANPANLPLTDPIPVVLHRTRVATGSDGDTLTINEKFTTTNTATGQDMGELDPRFAPTSKTLIVDRSTKVFLPGTDDGRTGQWGMPFHVDKNKVYPSWISAASRALDARYLRTEKLKGLETYVFEVRESDLPMGVDDPAGTGLPLVFDTLTNIWVEPLTGAGLHATLTDTVSAMDPAGNKYTRFSQTLAYSDASVTRLVKTGKDDHDRLVMFGTWLPWGAIIVGAVLLVAMAVGIWMASRSRGEATA
ncbi:MAG: porin PorA family protein [Dehalococcoidia bacterium]